MHVKHASYNCVPLFLLLVASVTSLSQSPAPPLPKPRSKNSVESNKQTPFPPLHTPISVTSSLPSSINDYNRSSSYENVGAAKMAQPDYEDIDVTDESPPPPPVPKPRQKNSADETVLLLSSPSSNNGRSLPSKPMSNNSGYENVGPTSPLVADYEDVNIDENTRVLDENHFNTGDRIVFLEESVYADPNAEKEDFYSDLDAGLDGGDPAYDQCHPQASNYEVPVNLRSSQIPPPHQSLNFRSTSLLPDTTSIPPVPPPRTRIKRESSIHRSLLDLGKLESACSFFVAVTSTTLLVADDGVYSELQSEELRYSDEDEHYGRLIRCKLM